MARKTLLNLNNKYTKINKGLITVNGTYKGLKDIFITKDGIYQTAWKQKEIVPTVTYQYRKYETYIAPVYKYVEVPSDQISGSNTLVSSGAPVYNGYMFFNKETGLAPTTLCGYLPSNPTDEEEAEFVGTYYWNDHTAVYEIKSYDSQSGSWYAEVVAEAVQEYDYDGIFQGDFIEQLSVPEGQLPDADKGYALQSGSVNGSQIIMYYQGSYYWYEKV